MRERKEAVIEGRKKRERETGKAETREGRRRKGREICNKKQCRNGHCCLRSSHRRVLINTFHED